MSKADDAEAIRTLIYRYGACIDAGDVEGVGKLFEHGTFQIAGAPEGMSGSEMIAAGFRASQRLYEGRPSTCHLFPNVIVDIDESAGTARASCNWIVFQALPDFPIQPIAAGRYHDQFARIDGEWCFTERLIMMDLPGDLSRHMSAEVDTSAYYSSGRWSHGPV